MMNRLMDAQKLEGSELRLAELFRATTVFEADPFRKRRVFANLMRTGSPRARRLWRHPAFVATLLVSGSAAAAFGQRYATDHGLFGFGTQPPAGALRALAPTRALTEMPAPSDTTANASSDDTAADSAASLVPPVSSAHNARRGSTEDVTRVVEAIQALRRDSDPSRAQRLLDEYLKAHPRGVLSADALALSIEAASAQHDPRAADYARRYLAQFPQGKYRDLANRALTKH
jgi:hypothetical protein